MKYRLLAAALALGAVVLSVPAVSPTRRPLRSIPRQAAAVAGIRPMLPEPERTSPIPPVVPIRHVEIESVDDEDDCRPAPTGTFEAMAVDGQGAPLIDVPLEIWIDGRAHAANTGDDGRIHMDGIEAGSRFAARAYARYDATVRIREGSIEFVFDRFGE